MHRHRYDRRLSLPLLAIAVGIVLIGAGAARNVVGDRSANAGDVPTTSRVAPPATLDPRSGAQGIDVSHWQHAVDWPATAAGGVRFALLKATDGRKFDDPNYALNHDQARNAGVAVAAYHYARPSRRANDATLQADHFVATADVGSGDLPPVLDLEHAGGLRADELQAWVTTWLERVTERLGVKPVIYVNTDFWRRQMADTETFAQAGYGLWLAHWNALEPDVPASGWAGHGWTFWQYSDCGTVAGVTGCVDLDRYRGETLPGIGS